MTRRVEDLWQVERKNECLSEVTEQKRLELDASLARKCDHCMNPTKPEDGSGVQGENKGARKGSERARSNKGVRKERRGKKQRCRCLIEETHDVGHHQYEVIWSLAKCNERGR